VPRTHGLRRFASWVSIAIVVSSLVGWGMSNRYLGSTDKLSVFGGIDEANRPKAISTEGMTILAVATDDRSGLTRKEQNALHVGHGDYGAPRTDTIMIIRVAPGGGGATAVSLPRDSWIAVPAYSDADGEQQAATHDRINTLYQRGGPELIIRTLEGITNLRIDHYVELNFAGFLNMVNAVDGVPMCIPKDVYDEDAGLDLKAGEHVLTGAQALAYVRARKIDSDFGRMERQQRFIASMVQRVTSAGTLLNPLKLNNFLDAAMSSVKTDETLDRDAVLGLATRFQGLNLAKIRFLTVPISDGNARIDGQSVVLWNDHEARKLFIRMAKDWPIVKEATTTTTTTTLTVQPGDMVFDPVNPLQHKDIPQIARLVDIRTVVMDQGRRTAAREPLDAMAARSAEQLRKLPAGSLRFINPHRYKVSMSRGLNDLRMRLMREISRQAASSPAVSP